MNGSGTLLAYRRYVLDGLGVVLFGVEAEQGLKSVFAPGKAIVVEVLGQTHRATMIVNEGDLCVVRIVEGDLAGTHITVAVSEVHLALESLEVVPTGPTNQPEPEPLPRGLTPRADAGHRWAQEL